MAEKKVTNGKKSKRAKREKARKSLLIVLLCYVLGMGVTYGFFTYYYSSHFFSGSKINGIDCTGKTVDEVKEHISDEILAYSVKINEKDGQSELITAPQIGMQYVEDGKIEELKQQQNPFLWFLAFTDKKDYDMSATTTYDKNKLVSVVEQLNCFQEANVVAPQDARLKTNADGLYEVEPEVEGNTLDKDKVIALLTDAIDTGKTEISLEESDCYLKPAVYSTDENLKKKAEQFNSYLNVKITYDFGGRPEVIDKEVIQTWLVEDEEGNITLDETKPAEFVQTLANKYDTFGLSRDFKTSGGETIKLKGGDYGWCLSKKKETAAIIELIKSGQSQENREPEYLYKGKDRSENDIGGTYIEVSISQQRMWCYKDGVQIVDTPIVTGNVSKSYDTPAGGCWAIDAKKRGAVLKGEGYSTPVTFWLPFNGNVGIHDADTWRSEYGGEIYKTSGSHGCVNTPYANAEKIFNNVEIGTPVVVY